MKTLLVGNGRVPPRVSVPEDVFDGVALVIAADGGAAACEALGLRPDLLVGDLDSAEPALVRGLERAGIEVRRVPVEKDESDLELALEAAIERGADQVVALGALGGPRIEHALSAVGLLLIARQRGVEMSLVDDRSTLRLLEPGPGVAGTRLDLAGETGDFVSLFPWGGDALGVVTEGLRYPLRDETLPMGPSRGLSNEMLGPAASVRCRSGRLLVVHTRRSAVQPVARDAREE
jgi:thiamine pyrophosphokinase